MLSTILFSFAVALSPLSNRLEGPAHSNSVDKLSHETPCQMRCELAFDECTWGIRRGTTAAECLSRIQACDSKCKNSDQEAETTYLEITTVQQCLSVCDERYEGCLYDHQPGYHQAAPPAWQSKCRQMVNQCSSQCRQTTEVTEVAEKALAGTELVDVFSPCVSVCLDRYEGCLYDHQPGYHEPAPPEWQAKCSSQQKQCSSKCRREEQVLLAKSSIVRGLAAGAAAALKIISA